MPSIYMPRRHVRPHGIECSIAGSPGVAGQVLSPMAPLWVLVGVGGPGVRAVKGW
jgi:hypothetical protein